MTLYIQNYMDISVNLTDLTHIPNISDTPLKVVVFDFDETIGYFSQFSSFITKIRFLIDVEENFFNLLDTFPQIFRPNIFNVFNILKTKKDTGKIDGVILYTNNCGGKEWVDKVINYIHHKLEYKLFDTIIYTHTDQRGRVIDHRRTSLNKSKTDLLYVITEQIQTSINILNQLEKYKYIDTELKKWLNIRLTWKTKILYQYNIHFYFFDDVYYPEMCEDINNIRFQNFFNLVKQLTNFNMTYMPETISHYYMVDKYHTSIDFKSFLMNNSKLVFKNDTQKHQFERELAHIQSDLDDQYNIFKTAPNSVVKHNYGKKILEIIEKI